MSFFLEIAVRMLASLVVVVIVIPVVALLSTPILLITSLADKDAYWSSFWWRLKRVLRPVTDFASLAGSSIP